MALTLGTTGMDRTTESEVQAAFEIANAQTGNKWTLVGGDEADYVVVDMESLYGPMSWLRLHAAGRKVIGLTRGERSQTDYRLPHPASATDLAVLLRDIAGNARATATHAEASEAPPAASTPAPSPADVLPVAEAVRPDMTEAAPDEAPAMVHAPVDPQAEDPAPPAATESKPEHEPQPEPAPEPEPEPVAAPERSLHAWLAEGGLPGRVRLQRDGSPTLLIDPAAKVWHGATALKAMAPYFEGSYALEDFETPDADTWARDRAPLGEAQPWSRLLWLAGLASGKGALLPGLDPDGQYRLKKWPQTEREYPKHFRIATAMMKGPATVAEVAEASGVAREDVCDFVNANLATGYAEPAADPAADTPAPASRGGGLLDRFRGR